jgi:hypothetical protein
MTITDIGLVIIDIIYAVFGWSSVTALEHGVGSFHVSYFCPVLRHFVDTIPSVVGQNSKRP